ncbi:hypothetical protein K523DRAFT_319579 [Schizophyllum commune Tattone D]|nr:hypothetical protein K523DRAFT_319579 [Schizophyllum commune Tattone D]
MAAGEEEGELCCHLCASLPPLFIARRVLCRAPLSPYASWKSRQLSRAIGSAPPLSESTRTLQNSYIHHGSAYMKSSPTPMRIFCHQRGTRSLAFT